MLLQAFFPPWAQHDSQAPHHPTSPRSRLLQHTLSAALHACPAPAQPSEHGVSTTAALSLPSMPLPHTSLSHLVPGSVQEGDLPRFPHIVHVTRVGTNGLQHGPRTTDKQHRWTTARVDNSTAHGIAGDRKQTCDTGQAWLASQGSEVAGTAADSQQLVSGATVNDTMHHGTCCMHCDTECPKLAVQY